MDSSRTGGTAAAALALASERRVQAAAEAEAEAAAEAEAEAEAVGDETRHPQAETGITAPAAAAHCAESADALSVGTGRQPHSSSAPDEEYCESVGGSTSSSSRSRSSEGAREGARKGAREGAREGAYEVVGDKDFNLMPAAILHRRSPRFRAC